MFLRRKFSPGFFRAVNRLLRLPGVRHATGALPTPDAATTMEKLDAALNKMSHGLCMFGPDNRLLLWNDRYVKMYKLAPPQRDRPQCTASSAFDEAPDRFLACLPLRKRMSISVPLTRTSSHRR